MRSSVLRVGFAVAALALATGCATGIKHQEIAARLPPLQPGEGRIYFYRPAAMSGIVMQPVIRLNGEVVGRSRPGGYFFVDRPPGNYTASATTETEKTVSFALRAGETKYIRSASSLGIVVGRIRLQLEPADKAQAELTSLSYTGEGAVH